MKVAPKMVSGRVVNTLISGTSDFGPLAPLGVTSPALGVTSSFGPLAPLGVTSAAGSEAGMRGSEEEKTISAPSERPSQFFCASTVLSDQSIFDLSSRLARRRSA